METLRYFYHSDHPDHLGSTSWVTDSAKNGVQYCKYLPYGEPLVDQRSTTWSNRYTFSGKERDSETGYSYFGARYYHPDLSIWLSVDPMSDKYPNLTPHNYCANNPVKLIDPNGMEIIDGGPDGPMGTSYELNKGNIPATTSSTSPPKKANNNTNTSSGKSNKTSTNNQTKNSSNNSNTSSTLDDVTLGIAIETAMVSGAAESSIATAATEAASVKVLTKVAKVSKGIGIGGGLVSTAVSAKELSNNPTLGNGVKTFINAAATVSAVFPGCGTAISIGLTAFDYFVGENLKFYEYLDNVRR
ncbi:MAG TPA: RHS repeat-associated core domain-containing protein [Bacteroidales bacterium]|jgi:RHS repeat-associated protein|nr:RHS repeat-associated core domain-containing protein [Bacteroidales bacterium]